MSGSQRMYADLAWTWPMISPVQEYEQEAGGFRRAFRRYARRPVQTVLDLGCGGGHNDFYLKRSFQVSGVDASESMLALARQLNPEVRYFTGDLRTIRLGQAFDAVLIADSIDYMLSEADLQAAFQTAYAHLHPGGVLCTYAEVTRERFEQNWTVSMTGGRDDVEIALTVNHYDPDPGDTTYEMTFVYLIRRAGQLAIETDQHLGGIFPLDTWHSCLAAAGFEVNLIEKDGADPFFACVRPLET